jgi:hypothetical protein
MRALTLLTGLMRPPDRLIEYALFKGRYKSMHPLSRILSKKTPQNARD